MGHFVMSTVTHHESHYVRVLGTYACPSHKWNGSIPHLTSQKSGHAFVQRLCDVNWFVRLNQE